MKKYLSLITLALLLFARSSSAIPPYPPMNTYNATLALYAAISPAANVQTFLGAANYAAMLADLSGATNNGSNWTFGSQAIGDLCYATSTTAYGRLADVAVGSVLASGGVGAAPAYKATAQSQSANKTPTAPANTSTYYMQGLAGTITPTRTGNILIIISGTVIAPTGTTVDNGILYQISYGTGSAPSNAGALAGTQVGPVQEYTSAVAPTAAADVSVPFSISAVVTGLSLSTAYWIDLAAKSVTTVSAMGLTNVQVSVIEQ